MPGYWTVYQRLTRRAKAIVASLCALLLVPVGYGSYWLYGQLTSCSDGGSTYLVHSGPTNDCVGYTDGSYVFDPSLAAVEGEIQKEDQQVTAQHPNAYVSVVLLLPISSAKAGSIMTLQDVLDQLRGAYTAQYYGNRNDVDGHQPYVNLLIGNAGYQANQWSSATSAIRGAVSSQHIAAVTGIGVSLSTTEDAARALAKAGIPVIGSTISSDYFDDIRNMIRVSPSNQNEIPIADSYAGTKFKQAILVEDENENDIYDSTLVTGFGKFTDTTHKIIGKEPYDTSYRDEPGSAATEQQGDQVVRNRISQMTTDICAAQPAGVLFAGRGRDLAELVGDLANRPCLNKPITIVTGDDVVNMPRTAQVRQGLASGVTVDYSGDADQDEWSTGSDAAVTEGRQSFATFQGTFQGLFQNVPLTDENTIMSYDAMLTAISAIRLTGLPQPMPYAVDAELPALQGRKAVFGASGPIAFSADWQHNPVASNPVGKPVPMLQLNPNGNPKFVSLNWPTGQPTSY